MRRLILLAICALTGACNQAAKEPEKDPPIATISGKQLSEAVELRDGRGGFLPLLQVSAPGTIKLACKSPERTTRWIINRRPGGLISVMGDTGHTSPHRLHQWRQMQSVILSGDPMREPHHPPALQAFELADGLITRYVFLSGSLQVISIPAYAWKRHEKPDESIQQRLEYFKEKGVLKAEGPGTPETLRLHDVFGLHAILGDLFEQPAELVQTWPCKPA